MKNMETVNRRQKEVLSHVAFAIYNNLFRQWD